MERSRKRRSEWSHAAAVELDDRSDRRRKAHAADAARRARVRYHARWIAINLVLIGASAWLYVNVLIPRFITKELSTQAAELVHADYDGSAPDVANRPSARVASATADRHAPLPRRSTHKSPANPRSAYADAATLEEMGAQCVDRRVFRKTVTNGVTEIAEVIGVRC